MTLNKSIDVACISNYPSAASLKFLRKFQGDPIDGNFFKPLYYKFLDVNGAVISINSGPNDLMNMKGIKEARRQFISVMNELCNSGVKVVLLAASLKRLFGHFADELIDDQGNSSNGENAKTIKQMYPNVIFTNGDNGTSSIFSQEIDFLLSKAKIGKKVGKVCVVGAGILGIKAIKHILSLGLEDEQIVVVSSFVSGIKDVAKEHDILIVPTLSDVDITVNAIINCTHKTTISAAELDLIGCKYVLDVAVPPGFPEEEYVKTKDVYRQDAGNAYSPNLRYEFDPQWIDLGTKHEMYGCFAEATSLAQYVKVNGYDFEGINIKDDINLFDVNDDNSRLASELFSSYNFTRHPKPLCFGRQV